MEEKINIEFTGKQFDFIMDYADLIDADTVQDAILNAVRIALDEENSK